MLPHHPEDWPLLFERHLGAGDLEAVVSLYEPGAVFVSPAGEIVVGRDAIRQVLAGLIDAQARLHGRVVKVVTSADIALLYTDWEGTVGDATGKSVESRHKAIEIVRRQPDGTWKLIVGDPTGRD